MRKRRELQSESPAVTAIGSAMMTAMGPGAAEVEADAGVEVAVAVTADRESAARETKGATVSRDRRADPATRRSPNRRQRRRSRAPSLSRSNKSLPKKKNGLKSEHLGN